MDENTLDSLEALANDAIAEQDPYRRAAFTVQLRDKLTPSAVIELVRLARGAIEACAPCEAIRTEQPRSAYAHMVHTCHGNESFGAEGEAVSLYEGACESCGKTTTLRRGLCVVCQHPSKKEGGKVP